MDKIEIRYYSVEKIENGWTVNISWVLPTKLKEEREIHIYKKMFFEECPMKESELINRVKEENNLI